MNESIIRGVGAALDLPEAERPKILTNTPRAGDLAAKHRELLDAIADLPVRLEIATDDAARKLGAVQQRERVKAAVLALLSDGRE